MEEPNLQPLRIVSGWNVEWNLFYEVDPSEKTMIYLDSSSLLHLNNFVGKVALNLEWSPEKDVNGSFILRILKLNVIKKVKGELNYEGDWENLLFEFRSKNRIAIVHEIEKLLVQF